MCNKNLIRVAILDDDPGALEILKATISALLKERKKEFALKTFTNGDNLLCEEENNDFDLLFCDIELPKSDGIQVASSYYEKHPTTTIVFISNREDRVFDSLKVHPFGFIRKKNFISDIQFIIDSYFKKMEQTKEEESLLLSFGTNVSRVLLSDIIYIESNMRNQFVYLASQKDPIEITSKMKTLTEELEDKGFILCHKAFLVNYRYIKSIDVDHVTLTTGGEVFLAKRKVKEVKQKFLSLIQNNDGMIL